MKKQQFLTGVLACTMALGMVGCSADNTVETAEPNISPAAQTSALQTENVTDTDGGKILVKSYGLSYQIPEDMEIQVDGRFLRTDVAVQGKMDNLNIYVLPSANSVEEREENVDFISSFSLDLDNFEKEFFADVEENGVVNEDFATIFYPTATGFQEEKQLLTFVSDSGNEFTYGFRAYVKNASLETQHEWTIDGSFDIEDDKIIVTTTCDTKEEIESVMAELFEIAKTFEVSDDGLFDTDTSDEYYKIAEDGSLQSFVPEFFRIDENGEKVLLDLSTLGQIKPCLGFGLNFCIIHQFFQCFTNCDNIFCFFNDVSPIIVNGSKFPTI